MPGRLNEAVIQSNRNLFCTACYGILSAGDEGWRLATTAAGSYSQRDPSFCQSYVVCAAGGAVPAASAGASVLIGRHVGVVGELASGQQSWSTRRLPLYDEEVALRQARSTPSSPRARTSPITAMSRRPAPVHAVGIQTSVPRASRSRAA